MSASDVLLLKNLEATARLDDAVIQKRLLQELVAQYVRLERRVSDLLRNTLPPSVADEIQRRERFAARPYECTILFADIVGFTRLAERISAEALIDLIDEPSAVSTIDRRARVKDQRPSATLLVASTPEPCRDHPVKAVRLAWPDRALAVLSPAWGGRPDRIGIHPGRSWGGWWAGPMQFDSRDHGNVASRFESSGAVGRVNCSPTVYERTRHRFAFEERGEIPLKNKGTMKAYFVIPGGVHERT
jgi:class 3 adenylate cyclase